MTKKYKSGQIVEKTGTYNEYNKNGEKVKTIECDRKERFPPSKKGGWFELKETK